MRPGWLWAPLLPLALVLAGCPDKPGDCLAGRDVSVARYDDCLKRCDQGEQSACKLSRELESQLTQACHRQSRLDACKAVCFGRMKNQGACVKARQLGSGG